MGSVESPGVVVDGGGDADMEAKKPGEAEKAKAKKLYVGSQALEYRRDHMEVILQSFPSLLQLVQLFTISKFVHGIMWQMIVPRNSCIVSNMAEIYTSFCCVMFCVELYTVVLCLGYLQKCSSKRCPQ